MMRYPIFIEEGSETTAYGVVFPDLPGCFSAADTLNDAVEAAKEAAAAWIDAALDTGEEIPPASTLDEIRKLPEYAGWAIGVVELDDALSDETIERVNITLPKRVLKRLDALARSRGQSRGAFISQLTLSAR